MNNNCIVLYKNFIKIKNNNWIKSMRDGSGGIGYTFESLIGKNEDTLSLPDFNDIEIKTIRKGSRGIIHLFSIRPDGGNEEPMKHIRDILGYPDKKYRQFKVFNMDFNCKEYTKIGYYKKGKLEIDRNKEIIRFLAFDNKNQDLGIDVFWTFGTIKNRLNQKLKKLAIIEAESKTMDNKEFFHYKNINFYLLDDFERFIDLIEKGIITIEFRITFHKDLIKFGEIKNRGTIFSIKLDDIDKLYKKVPLYLFNYQLMNDCY